MASPMIKVRPTTRTKIDLISKIRRWTLAETIDALADEYIENHSLDARTETVPATVHALEAVETR